MISDSFFDNIPPPTPNENFEYGYLLGVLQAAYSHMLSKEMCPK